MFWLTCILVVFNLVVMVAAVSVTTEQRSWVGMLLSIAFGLTVAVLSTYAASLR